MSRTLSTYTVTTDRFGDVEIEAYDIADARRDAKQRFGSSPKCVRRTTRYRRCDDCDSAPCVCRAS